MLHLQIWVTVSTDEYLKYWSIVVYILELFAAALTNGANTQWDGQPK